MHSTVSIGVFAVLVGGLLSAQGSEPENAMPTYSVEITLTNRTTKKEEFALKGEIAAGKPDVIRSIRQRPFVTGFSNSTANEPIIQIVDCGATAHVKIAETEPGVFIVDATIELSDVCDVAVKRYPGTDKMVQAVRIRSATTRLIETVSVNDKLKSTLDTDGLCYDVTLSVVDEKRKLMIAEPTVAVEPRNRAYSD